MLHVERGRDRSPAVSPSRCSNSRQAAKGSHRLLLIALCQGGALHYLDCKKEAKKTNGVKDLDVYSSYADDPEIPWPYRRHGVADFGESEFGHHRNKRHDFVGRHVDLMGRALLVETDTNPVEAGRTWLAASNNAPPALTRKSSRGATSGQVPGQSHLGPRRRSAGGTESAAPIQLRSAPPPCQW